MAYPQSAIAPGKSLLLLAPSHSPPISRTNISFKCSSIQSPLSTSTKDAAAKHVLAAGLAACFMLLSPSNQVLAIELPHNSLCQIASASNNIPTLNLDEPSNLMMMRGMTARNFDPVRYSGRWYEVASLKGGFAGQGQGDCHCTQGVYTIDMKTPAIQVDTFCVHGGPDGYITGIRGNVQCLSEEETEKTETDLERKEMIKEKCYLRFPTLPFIPKEPYDVLDTDYDNFALVSGAKDKSFIQIYSRTPNPGTEFIEKYKLVLADFGYDASKIKDTPQDCEVSDSRLAAMMSMNGMQQALTNQFPDLELKSAVEFNPFTSVFDTFKKLVQLYFKQ
ncbi:putative zeaxanthin epoxidase [Helianthus debilis subsp. tardiflorus]